MSAEVGQVLDGPTVVELLATFGREHSRVEEAVTDALRHAIRAGEALLAAKALVRDGEWLRWWDANLSVPRTTGLAYMRLAEGQHHLPSGVSIKAALRLLQEHGVDRSKSVPRIDLATRDEVARLLAEGVAKTAVARRLGVSRQAVHAIADPAYRAKRKAADERRRARRRAALKALRRQEQDKAATGTPFSAVYAGIHDLTDRVGAFADNAATPEHRAIANAALARLHEARDEIVKGLGL